jgi:hypothetical protein
VAREISRTPIRLGLDDARDSSLAGPELVDQKATDERSRDTERIAGKPRAVERRRLGDEVDRE